MKFKKSVILIILGLALIFLTSCFKTRTELFNLHIEEDTYYLNENLEETIKVEDNIITFISLTFKDLNKVVSDDHDYSINTFGDFSFQEIKLFEVELYLGLNYEEPLKYDLTFKGRANPGRSNAYKLDVTIDNLNSGYKDFILVLDLRINIGGMRDKIGSISLQLKNPALSGSGFNVTLRNELESRRKEALDLLNKTFLDFKRDDYEQEDWNEIFNININARESLNFALDVETIELLIDQALEEFSNVPQIEVH